MTDSISDDRSRGARGRDTGAFAPAEPAVGAIMRRLIRGYVAPRWRLIAGAVVAMAVVAGTTGALPFLMQAAADRIFNGKDEQLLWLLPPLIVVVMGLRSVAEYFARIAQGYLSNRVVADLRGELYERLAFADIGFLQSAHSGRFVSIVQNDVSVVNLAATQSLTGMVQNGLQVIGLVVAMFWMDPILATIVTAALPVGTVALRKQKRKAHRAVDDTLKGVGRLGAMMAETLQAIRVVKSYNREAEEAARARREIEATLAHMMTTVKNRAATGPITEGLGGIAIAAAIFYGGWQGIHGSLTLGSFMGFMTAAMLLYQPVKALASLHNQLIEGATAAARVFAVLDHEQKITELPGAVPLKPGLGAIRFEGVGFAYEPGKPVLDDFSLDIPAGSRVALVGPSGSGKSTVMNLILRFFDPDAGRVLIDGQDIREATIASTRRASALLTQDPVLFDDTVIGNIRYGSEAASEAAVIAAAQAAAAHDFIMGLPNGYQTQVGEGGGLLSGGQKQRIAFARAMLRGAPILLLDEPTSALDAESEAKIQEALDTSLVGRTVIVIAHRLSTVKKADLIVVLDAGRIVEIGRHQDLVDRGGVYARLYASQFDDGDAGAGAAATAEGV